MVVQQSIDLCRARELGRGAKPALLRVEAAAQHVGTAVQRRQRCLICDLALETCRIALFSLL